MIPLYNICIYYVDNVILIRHVYGVFRLEGMQYTQVPCLKHVLFISCSKKYFLWKPVGMNYITFFCWMLPKQNFKIQKEKSLRSNYRRGQIISPIQYDRPGTLSMTNWKLLTKVSVTTWNVWSLKFFLNTEFGLERSPSLLSLHWLGHLPSLAIPTCFPCSQGFIEWYTKN